MVYTLGINIFSHDSSAALLKDNKIICAIEEERLNRKKHYFGFPKLAISKCLEIAGLELNDIDVIASDGITQFTRKVRIKDFVRLCMYEKAIREIKFYKEPNSVNTTGKCLKDNGFDFDSQINVFDHHQCHAASAFFPSGLKEATVVTADAKGFYTTQTAWQGNREELTFKDIKLLPDSPGYIYKYITYKCGFGSFSEGTTMALAPYGKPVVSEKLQNLFPLIQNWTDIMNLIDSQEKIPAYNEKDLLKSAYDKLSPEDKEKIDEIDRQTKEDLAASVQKWLEDYMTEYILKHRKGKNLALGGGTFLNCILNSKLKTSYFDEVFTQPAAGDSGISLGAAILANSNKCEKMTHVYLGPEYSDDYIESLLEDKKMKFETSNERHAAELISKGKIVGWFQGRMEYGPRALGNRSILADPSNLKTKERLNKEVKFREGFRPYAPSVLVEDMEEYFENPCSSPFMTMVFKVKQEKKKIVPGIVHVDGTSRVQTVNRETNLKYYRLISEFKNQTKIPMIINTSFNTVGEPIVCSPEEAIATFLNTGMDCLFLNNYLVIKNEK
jgi:carbamoyltransferase